jgi:hypothetical protein
MDGYALAVKAIAAVVVLPAASVMVIVAVNDEVAPELIPLVRSAKVTADDQLFVPVAVRVCGQPPQFPPLFMHLPSIARLRFSVIVPTPLKESEAVPSKAADGQVELV